MNPHLKTIQDHIQQNNSLSTEEKEILLNALADAAKEFSITEFKLDRTEKVKKTTGILLEETIRELELKRKAVEESNTALQKSLEDLKAAQAQLIQSEKMASLGELTAGIAHEIQNPLNFVNNFSDVNAELIDELKSELAVIATQSEAKGKQGNLESAIELADNIKDNEQKINQHGKRADGIVKGMLQHSRTGSGQKEPTDVNVLADEYLRLAYHGYRAKEKSFNAKFETDFDSTIDKIHVIPQDIGRVLLNLINNAFYAVNEKQKRASESSAGQLYEPKIMISTKKVNARPDDPVGRDKIKISVVDNGIGMPQKVQDKIFQPFFTTKPTGSGTGLGLSISYDIVRAHGGEITVSSAEGEGSEFIVRLPVSQG